MLGTFAGRELCLCELVRTLPSILFWTVSSALHNMKSSCPSSSIETLPSWLSGDEKLRRWWVSASPFYPKLSVLK